MPQTAQVVIGHKQLARTVTMEVSRDLLHRAQSGYNPQAKTALLMQFKQQYQQEHGRRVGFLPTVGLLIEETDESKARPQGCGCECAGCDQGHHCRKTSKDCYL